MTEQRWVTPEPGEVIAKDWPAPPVSSTAPGSIWETPAVGDIVGEGWQFYFSNGWRTVKPADNVDPVRHPNWWRRPKLRRQSRDNTLVVTMELQLRDDGDFYVRYESDCGKYLGWQSASTYSDVRAKVVAHWYREAARRTDAGERIDGVRFRWNTEATR